MLLCLVMQEARELQVGERPHVAAAPAARAPVGPGRKGERAACGACTGGARRAAQRRPATERRTGTGASLARREALGEQAGPSSGSNGAGAAAGEGLDAGGSAKLAALGLVLGLALIGGGGYLFKDQIRGFVDYFIEVVDTWGPLGCAPGAHCALSVCRRRRAAVELVSSASWCAREA